MWREDQIEKAEDEEANVTTDTSIQTNPEDYSKQQCSNHFEILKEINRLMSKYIPSELSHENIEKLHRQKEKSWKLNHCLERAS